MCKLGSVASLLQVDQKRQRVHRGLKWNICYNVQMLKLSKCTLDIVKNLSPASILEHFLDSGIQILWENKKDYPSLLIKPAFIGLISADQVSRGDFDVS